MREVLASVGARSIDEVIGRADLLTQVSRGAEHLDDLDLNPLLISVVDGAADYDRKKPRNAVPDTLDALQEGGTGGARHGSRGGPGAHVVLQGQLCV